ncbi:MAG: hypothetical protein RL095_2513 [Verrucomicrobiota bacterium]|jgi:hypothetical protein
MRFSFARYLGSVAAFILLYWACTWTGSAFDTSKFKLFYDMPSLLIVFGVSLAIVMARHGQDAWRRLLPAMFLSPCTRRQQADEELAKLVKTAIGSAWLSGGFGLLVGLILLLANLNDPTKLGGALAVSILCPLYAFVLHLWLFVTIGWAQSSEEGTTAIPEPSLARKAGLMALTPFSAILILSFICSYNPEEGQRIHGSQIGEAVPDDEFDFGVIEANLAGPEKKQLIKVNLVLCVAPGSSSFCSEAVLGKQGWSGNSLDCSHRIRARLQEEMSTWTLASIEAPDARQKLAEKLLNLARETIATKS